MPDQIETNSELDGYLSELEPYLSDHIGRRMFDSLEGIYDQLEFFKIFHQLLELVQSGKSLSAINEIDTLDLSGGIKLFLTHFLCERLRFDSTEVDEGSQDNLLTGLHLIEKLHAQLEATLPVIADYGDLLFFVPETGDDRARAAVALDKATSSSVDSAIRQAEKESSARVTHDRLIEAAAKESEKKRLLRALVELREKTSEFTMSRQVLALRLMLKQLGAKNNKALQARFIQFLIGKTHKDIYDTVREPNLIFSKEGKDAAYVKTWFNQLGLTEIEKDIDAHLNRPSHRLPPSRRKKSEL